MKFMMLFLKLSLTFLLIYLAVGKIDFSHSIHMLSSKVGILILTMSVFIVIAQSILAGYRTKWLLSKFNYTMSSYQAICFLFIGNFFSQTMLSFIGGDTVRILGLKKIGVNSDSAVKSVLLDRVLGFIGLQVLLLCTLPFALKLTSNDSLKIGLILLAAASLAMIIGFFLSSLIKAKNIDNRFVAKFLDFGSISRYLFQSKLFCTNIILFSTFLHFCNMLVIYICSNALGGELSLFNAVVIGCPVMLVSLLPISVGGWGIRENFMIIGLGLVNVSPDIALTVSIVVGAANALGALPGAVLFLFKQKSIPQQEWEPRTI